jgi:hypothetical protein
MIARRYGALRERSVAPTVRDLCAGQSALRGSFSCAHDETIYGHFCDWLDQILKEVR